MNVSLKQLVSQSGGGGRPINLEANDVILVGPKEPLVSNNTLAVVTLITSVLGVVVSGIVISNQLKGK